MEAQRLDFHPEGGGARDEETFGVSGKERKISHISPQKTR
jgi:hypothetical protein